MRLKIFDAIREGLKGPVAPRYRLKGLHVSRLPDAPDEIARSKVIVTFEAKAWFQLACEDTGPAIAEARIKAEKALARHFYDDLRNELLDLYEWAGEEGIGQDLEDKLTRLIALVSGDDVEERHE